MAETIGSLEVRLRADISKLESDLKKAEGKTKTFGNKVRKNMQGAFGGLGKVRVKLGLVMFALAQIAALGGLNRLIHQSLDAADALGKTAKKLGISTAALQELEFAANQSGVKLEALRMGLQRFGRRAAEAAGGTGEAQDAIKQLGIELTDGQGALRSTEALFMDAMHSLAEIENPLERVRLGFKLFDSEGVALVNMAGNVDGLRDEAVKLGLVLDDEVIAKSSETKDTLEALSRVTKSQLTPALSDLGGNALVAVAETMARVATWANKVYRSMADMENLGLSNLYQRRIEAMEELAEAQADLHFESIRLKRMEEDSTYRGRDKAPQQNMVTALREQIDSLRKEVPKLEDQIKKVEDRRDEAEAKARGAGAAGTEAAQTAAQLKRSLAERQKLQKDAHDELMKLRGEDIQFAKDAAAAKMELLDNATDAENEATNHYFQARRDIEDALAIEIAEINKDSADEIKSIRDGLNQSYLQSIGKEEEAVEAKLKNEIEALRENIDERFYLESQFQEDKVKLEAIAAGEIQDIREKDLEDEKKANEKKRKDWDKLSDFMQDGFNDALATMLIDGEFTFKKLGEAYLREFVQLAIKRSTVGLFDSLLKTVGSFFGPSMSSAELNIPNTGASVPISSLPMEANGGPISGASIVGERGPELFIPKTSGFVASNSALGRMGGGGGNVVVNVVNNSSEKAETTESTNADGTRHIEVLIGKAVAQNIHRGGTIDSAIRNSYGLKRPGSHP